MSATPIIAKLEPVPADLALPAPDPLESLGSLIVENLARHESLSAKVRQDIVDTLENAVRAGWYISDAQTYLATDAGFVAWVELNLPITYNWAHQLSRLSKSFARDLVDVQTRSRLHIYPEGLSSVPSGIHLREQIIATGASSIRQLLRLTGVVKTESRNNETNGTTGGKDHGGAHGTSHGRSATSDLSTLARDLQVQLNKRPPYRLTAEQRADLIRELRPIAGYFEQLQR
jgi:hypothetical protein